MSAEYNAQSRSKRRIHPGVFAAIVVLVFTGTVGIGASLGAWQTNGRGSGDGAGGGGGGGAGGGGQIIAPQDRSTTDIKGWMAIGDVATAWAVPLPEILANFNLPADTPPSTPLKDLESDLFSVSALRDWLASRPAGATVEAGEQGAPGDSEGP